MERSTIRRVMTARPTRAFAFAILVAAAASLTVRTAGATPAPSARSVTGLHFLSDACGFPITNEGVIYTTTLTRDDHPTLQHVRVDVALTANGKTAYERASFSVVIDPARGTVTLEGTLVNISAPSGGVLLEDVGRIVRDLGTGDVQTLVGQWMVLDGEFDAVCSYFAS